MADAAERWDPTQTSSSTETQEAQDAAREKAEELKETVRDSSTQLGSSARDWMQREADQRTTAVASQARTIADAMRQTSSRLDQDGQPQAARMTDVFADRVEQVAGYLDEADGQRVMNDVQDLARRNPWAFAAAGLAVGFAASRFMKASRPTGSTSSAGSLPDTGRTYATTRPSTYRASGTYGTTGDLPAAPGSATTGTAGYPSGAYGETGSTES